jgi:hypothetical protein
MYCLFVVVPVWDPKDLFIECITMFTAQGTRLIWVGLVEYHVIFPVSGMFRAERHDVTSWT